MLWLEVAEAARWAARLAAPFVRIEIRSDMVASRLAGEPGLGRRRGPGAAPVVGGGHRPQGGEVALDAGEGAARHRAVHGVEAGEGVPEGADVGEGAGEARGGARGVPGEAGEG